ncbi:MAG: hypothetical protein SNG27_07345 [Rikenellaceae bacterium]
MFKFRTLKTLRREIESIWDLSFFTIGSKRELFEILKRQFARYNDEDAMWQFVENNIKTFQKYRIEVNPEEITSSVAVVRNKAVKAKGDAFVYAFGISGVYATQTAFVKACGNSIVIASDEVSVFAADQATVYATDNSSVNATGDAKIEARGASRIVAKENVSVCSYDNTYVYLSNYVDPYRGTKFMATFNANGKSVVKISGGAVRGDATDEATIYSTPSTLLREVCDNNGEPLYVDDYEQYAEVTLSRNATLQRSDI